MARFRIKSRKYAPSKIKYNTQVSSRSLRFLYRTVPGRVMLKLLSSRRLSKMCGEFLDSPLSRPLVRRFVKKAGINRSDYVNDKFRSFNECFTRKIRGELRPIDQRPDALIAPCDGHLSAYPITEGLVLPIKQSRYSVSELLNGDPIWQKYKNGLCLVFRLAVDNYHRYCYIDDGIKGDNTFLPGKLHTVQPIALSQIPVFTRNCREYTVMQTRDFGEVTQVEVGAMLVGKILNHHGASVIHRGEEKGLFQYGGSTIVLLLPPDSAALNTSILINSRLGVETPVCMGEAIGRAIGEK